MVVPVGAESRLWGGSAGRSLGLCRRCSGRPWEGLMTAGEARSSFHLKSTTLPLCEDWTGRVEGPWRQAGREVTAAETGVVTAQA